MGGIGCLAFIAFGIWILITAFGGTPYSKLLKTGIPARGILLKVDSVATPVIGGTFRVESRGVTVDVETAGRPPFEVRGRAFIPANLRNLVLPGSTVELRLDPKKPTVFAIIGPGSGYVQPSNIAPVRNPPS